jgi:hypothetical protein
MDVLPMLQVGVFTNSKKEIATSLGTMLENIDVVCIIGMTNKSDLWKPLKSSNFIHVHTSPKEGRDSWNAIYSKVPIKKKGYIHYTKTKQNRGLIWCSVEVPTKDDIREVYIITSEFEKDGEGSVCRKYQAEQIFRIDESKTVENAKSKNGYIFAGDTNLPDWQSIDLFDGWLDSWVELGTSQNQSTSDTGDRTLRIWYRDITSISFDLKTDSNTTGTSTTSSTSYFISSTFCQAI